MTTQNPNRAILTRFNGFRSISGVFQRPARLLPLYGLVSATGGTGLGVTFANAVPLTLPAPPASAGSAGYKPCKSKATRAMRRVAFVVASSGDKMEYLGRLCQQLEGFGAMGEIGLKGYIKLVLQAY